MIGYLNESAAHAAGFTHHGRYYGIPVWLGDIEGESLNVRAKWAPCEMLLHAAIHIEGFMVPILYPDDDSGFMFKVGRRIVGAK